MPYIAIVSRVSSTKLNAPLVDTHGWLSVKDSSEPLAAGTLGSLVSLPPRFDGSCADVRWVKIMTETDIQKANTLHS
jgi:hypothetical protein